MLAYATVDPVLATTIVLVPLLVAVTGATAS